ncbi:MAG: hypothetical protein R2722_14755 [Tessaracoccus sp.]
MDSATHLLDLHVKALYRLDERGCLIATNEATPNPAPRVSWGGRPKEARVISAAMFPRDSGAASIS